MDSTNVQKKLSQESTFIVDLEDCGQISCVCFSPYELSQDLFFIALPIKILVVQIITKVTYFLMKAPLIYSFVILGKHRIKTTG